MNASTRASGVAQAIAGRRALKGFDPEHRMQEAEFNYLLEHAILSPTGFNLQHWRFVRLRDPELRRALRAVAWDQPQVTDASELLVLCFDQQAWRKAPERYWHNAPQEARDYVLPAIRQYYEGREQLQRDEGMRSCALAAQSLMLLAWEMGYDSCPLGGFDFDAAARLIGLPADHHICMMLAIGKGVREPWPRAGQLALDEVLVTDRF